MHVAVIGTGRVGQMTLMALVHESWITRLTLVDTAPGLAEAVGEEIRHSLASTRISMEVRTHDKDEAVEGADIVLVTAGTPRTPKMEDRTDLTRTNAAIIKQIARTVVPKNPSAKYVIVTNPVDAMATLFNRITRAAWVISAGTNLDSQRFRSELAKCLDVPISAVTGFVGGEHGRDAVFLWSTVRIDGMPLERYLEGTKKTLDREQLERSVKEISRMIIKVTGGTRQGPATSFRDIVRSIALNDNRVLSIAAPYEAAELPEPVMVSIPQMVGKHLGPTLEPLLSHGEKLALRKAARKIYNTYQAALESL